MSTSDTIAYWGVIVFAFQAFIFVVQSVLLWWYASETRKIRLDAAAQNLLIAKQLENANKQNEIISEQLEMMNKAHQLQLELVRASETAEFLFLINFTGATFSLLMDSLNENVHLMGFFSNDRSLTVSLVARITSTGIECR